MPVELKVPAAGESITEVQVVEWRKSEGDDVEQDEILLEIETDKATMEIPSPAAGTLAKVLHPAGDIVPVGEVLAEIEPAKSDDDGRKAKDKKREAKQEAAEAAEKTEQEAEKEAKAEDQQKPTSRTEPEVEAPRSEDRRKQRDRDEGDSGAGREPMAEVHALVMPAARRALAEYGLKPGDVEGSGPGGRVLKEDVFRRVAGRPDDEKKASREQPRESPVISGARREEVVPMSMLRRRVAERLVKAQQAAALLTTFNEVDMSAVHALRSEHQEAFQKRYGIKIGLMSFFVKAAIDALKLFPQLNAEVRGTDIVYRDYYDVGVAVSTDKGLVVPVLRNAERMSFAEVEQAIADLATRARDKKLDLAELEGGTFTITNGGVFGSLLSTPIINPPQSGILGLHAIQDRPVARGGAVVIRPMMYIALTYDHRIVDGREAVTFLRRIKECVEAPARMLIEV